MTKTLLLLIACAPNPAEILTGWVDSEPDSGPDSGLPEVEPETLPLPMAWLDATTWGGLVIFGGGQDEAGLSAGTWISDASLDDPADLIPPYQPTVNASLAVVDDHLLVHGGDTGDWVSYCTSVTPLGETLDWTTACEGNDRRTGHEALVWQGRSYRVGGDDGTQRVGRVVSADNAGVDLRSEDATLSAWRTSSAGAVVGDRALMVSGSQVLEAHFSDDGLGPFTEVGQVAGERAGHVVLVHDELLLIVGGLVDHVPSDRVWAAPLHDLDAWSEHASLPEPVHAHGAVILDDQLLVLGGITADGEVSDAVHRIAL